MSLSLRLKYRSQPLTIKIVRMGAYNSLYAAVVASPEEINGQVSEVRTRRIPFLGADLDSHSP